MVEGEVIVFQGLGIGELLTVGTLVIAGVVWLVRLEGRASSNLEAIVELKRDSSEAKNRADSVVKDLSIFREHVAGQYVPSAALDKFAAEIRADMTIIRSMLFELIKGKRGIDGEL